MKFNWMDRPTEHMAEIKQALDAKADANHFIDGDDTPLMRVFEHGVPYFEVIKILLEAGADANFFKKQKHTCSPLTPCHNPHAENVLTLVLYCYSSRRFDMVKLLLKYGANVYWKGEKGFTTALNPFFQHLYACPPPPDKAIENLSILAALLDKGAGSLPTLFIEYNNLAISPKVYRHYAYLAVLGYYFISKIQQIQSNPILQILHDYFPLVLSSIVIEYYADSSYFNKAVERLFKYINTHPYFERIDFHADQTPKVLPHPDYPLSLAAYTEFSQIPTLIEAKADVTFIDAHTELSPLDYAVKRNLEIERDSLEDLYNFNAEKNRFNRVKIITDSLKNCYRQTLLGEAQRITEQHQVKSSSKVMS